MLHVHRAERADGLIEALRAVLAVPLEDPFAAEVVAVPTRGMERWLTQRLSSALGAQAGRADGVCANVEFPSPRRLVSDAVALASGVEPDADPWLPERAVWPLLEVVDASLDEPWLRVLAEHLGARDDELKRARRFSTVRHLAGLFDRYGLDRPEMVRGWAAGEGDHWQARLWHRLRERIGTPSPAERTDGACARLRGEPALLTLPPRLALFGLTRLPAGRLDVLRAIAAARDVHLFLLHPSPALWNEIAAAGPAHAARRAEDRTGGQVHNRLLRSWGRDARELQLVLTGAGEELVDHHHPTGDGDQTLLQLLQRDIRANDAPPGEPLPDAADERRVVAADDRSVQVHACHGRARQVEILRDALLHEFQQNPELEPRDVIVMCPDIEEFAPLIHATFGAGETAEDDDGDGLAEELRPIDLRVRLADRSLRQTNPVLGVVARTLELAAQRMTASEVLDLADREPVRRRFRLTDDGLARIEDWVADSGIRWGLDAAHRSSYKLGDLEAGTWRAGLDRVLVGVTMSEQDQRLFGPVLPVDDVESGAIDLAGRLAEFVARLQAAVDDLRAPRPIDAWATSIAAAADALTATAPTDAWQRTELQRILDDVVTEATSSGAVAAPSLGLPEIRELLAERLQGRPTRANFRTGHMTVCTLVPMRSVPHRVVCLLGLDDACFPRKAPRDGDDLALIDARVGERDPRSEDRQMLLDALMAAGDRLIITYTGNDERTNAPRPPAVPVGELLDAVDRTARLAGGGRARDLVVTGHPLQPFDVRNFETDELMPDRAWSFDRAALAGARALSGDRSVAPPFLAEPLRPCDDDVIELADLVRFVEHPVRAFLKQRLDIDLRDFSREPSDALPIQLGHLDRWSVGDRLLAARLAGHDARSAYRAEIARGTLPPGQLGRHVIVDVLPEVEAIVGAAEQVLGTTAASTEEIWHQLDRRRVVNGTVQGVRGNVIGRIVFSKVGPKHRLAAWAQLLALTLADPERPFQAVTVGRAQRRSATVTVSTIGPLGEDPDSRAAAAAAAFEVLLDLYRRGLREPAPLYCKTSAAYAQVTRDGGNAIAAAAKEWDSEFSFKREDDEAEHQLVLGGMRSFEWLRRLPPRDDEREGGWSPTEPTRVGRWALRLWDPLLDHEEITSQ